MGSEGRATQPEGRVPPMLTWPTSVSGRADLFPYRGTHHSLGLVQQGGRRKYVIQGPDGALVGDYYYATDGWVSAWKAFRSLEPMTASHIENELHDTNPGDDTERKVRPATPEEEEEMPGWGVLVPPSTDEFLPPDDPLVRALGRPGERFLPAVDVVDWWEHSDPEARRISTGIAGVPRQLVISTERIIVSTERIIVMKDGSVERSFPVRAISGAELRDPPDGQNQGSEKAVLVKFNAHDVQTVAGMWSMTPEQASLVIAAIFKFSHSRRHNCGFRS
jgi:hypothetical protein